MIYGVQIYRIFHSLSGLIRIWYLRPIKEQNGGGGAANRIKARWRRCTMINCYFYWSDTNICQHLGIYFIWSRRFLNGKKIMCIWLKCTSDDKCLKRWKRSALQKGILENLQGALNKEKIRGMPFEIFRHTSKAEIASVWRTKALTIQRISHENLDCSEKCHGGLQSSKEYSIK